MTTVAEADIDDSIMRNAYASVLRKNAIGLLSETRMWNANAFSLNAMVDVRRRRRLKWLFLISQKLLKLATSKFNAT